MTHGEDEHLEASYEERYDPVKEEKSDDIEDEDIETCALSALTKCFGGS